MKLNKTFFCIVALVLFAFALGCTQELGKVDQGRVIAYDKEKRTVTLIQDKKAEPGKPDYNTLPPHTYSLPTDPMEMGPEPKAGKRMKLDVENKQIVIFDDATQGFLTIDFKLIDKKEGIKSDNPLVKDKKFPIIERSADKKTVTLYSARQRLYVVIELPEEHLSRPDDTWDAGDEVRIYYKEPGKALRFMNISKTDIYKK